MALLLGFELCPLNFGLRAAVPTFDHLFPVALQAGTTNAVTAVGKFDPWPPKAWVDVPGIVFQPETNSGKFSVEVAADAPIGPHLVRLFNEHGASGPRFLVVTREPQILEQEPNDEFANPQTVATLPAWLNGRLEKSGDVDSFAVTLAAGQTIVASLEAFTLASPVDAVLRLVDARGVQVAWNHDGRTLDPFLAWTATSAGTYVLQVFGFVYPAESAIRFTGNAKCVYRLQLSGGPYARHTLPLGVSCGTNTPLQVVGWNLGAATATHVQFDGGRLGGDAGRAPLQLAGFDNTLLLPLGDGPELVEQEPNDAAAETNRLIVPGAITGCIQRPEDEDRFGFAAKKGEKFLLSVQSATLGFPLDAWLRVENAQAKELAKNDDSGGADPKLEWTAGDDGTFVAAVGSVLHRGGEDYYYRLQIQRAAPAVKLSLSETSLTLTAGKTNDLKVTVKRLHDYQRKLTVGVRELPAGVEAAPVEVPEKGDSATLKFVVSADAKPFSGPIQVVATEAESGKEHRAFASLTSSTVDNGVPGGFHTMVIESTDLLWLTVQPAPAAETGAKK